MSHQEFEPPQALRDTIKCFWYGRWEFGAQPVNFEVVPDGYAEIIFHFGSGLSHDSGLNSLPSPFMMGLLNQPALFCTKNRLEILGIRCFPWTVFDLLGLPSGKDGVHTFEHPIAALQFALNALVDSGKIEEAVAELTKYFMNVNRDVTEGTMLLKAGTAMKNANGTMRVNRVAEAAHTTVRTLERKFKQSSGYTVKDVSSLMRFEQVRNHLWLHPDSNLAGLAHELGYTDQAHLTREFKRYSGATPAAFARNAEKDKLAVNSNLIALAPS